MARRSSSREAWLPFTNPGHPSPHWSEALRSLRSGPRVRSRCGSWYEARAREAGFGIIAGVDEVGRGALFGPVIAAAVVLNPERRIRGIRDSKRLTVKERERLSAEIREYALAWSIASVEASEIDQINIYQASRVAMRTAVLTLSLVPDLVLVDALRLDIDIPQLPIIRGDALSISVAAASIIAKVERDALMREWDRVYPQYGLARNKGYSTPAHRRTLKEAGPSPMHRYTYAPVAANGSRPTVVQQFLFGAMQ